MSLLLLLLVLAGLLGLLPCALLAGRPGAWRAAGGLCGACLLAVLLFLLLGAEPAALPLPLGVPGWGAVLTLDPLSGLFLLPVLLGGCVLLWGPAEPRRAGRRGTGMAQLASARVARPVGAGGEAPVPPRVEAAMLVPAAAALPLLAGDAPTLALGVAALGLAGGWLLGEGAAVGRRLALWSWLAASGAATVALLAATALLLPADGATAGLGFPALRAAAAAGWRADAAVVPALVAACALGAVPPLGGWLPRLCRGLAPVRAATLLAAAGALGPYLLVRLLLDLSGPATPAWWGLPPLLLGALGTVAGGASALLAGEVRGVAAGAALSGGGLSVLLVGLSLLARGMDLPVPAAAALGGAVLAVLADAPVRLLLLLGAGAIERGAGTRRLDRLGGLVRRTPAVAAALLAAGASLACLPPTAGFAAAWLALEGLLAAPRLGGPALALPELVALCGLGLGLGLGLLAALRLVGAVLLGRPRSPRGAAAEDAAPVERRVLLGLVAVLGVLGLLPGVVVGLAAPGLRPLIGSAAEGAGVLLLATQRDAAGYPALPLAAVMAAVALPVWLRGRLRRQEARVVPAWEDGFAAPPPWLPFGDPDVQPGAAALLGAPGRVLAGQGPAPRWRDPLRPVLPALLRLGRRGRPWLLALGAPAAGWRMPVLATTALLLLGVALWGR